MRPLRSGRDRPPALLDAAEEFAAWWCHGHRALENLRPNCAWAEPVPKTESCMTTEWETQSSPEGHGGFQGCLVRPTHAPQASSKAPITRLHQPHHRLRWESRGQPDPAVRACLSSTAASRPRVCRLRLREAQTLQSHRPLSLQRNRHRRNVIFPLQLEPDFVSAQIRQRILQPFHGGRRFAHRHLDSPQIL